MKDADRDEEQVGSLDIAPKNRHFRSMSTTAPVPQVDDEDAEAVALAAAVAEARADPRAIPHEEMQAWLLRLAAGEFDAPPPIPRLL